MTNFVLRNTFAQRLYGMFPESQVKTDAVHEPTGTQLRDVPIPWDQLNDIQKAPWLAKSDELIELGLDHTR